MPQGFAGVQAAAALSFCAYIGFDAVSTAAKKPRIRNAMSRSAIIGRWQSVPYSTSPSLRCSRASSPPARSIFMRRRRSPKPDRLQMGRRRRGDRRGRRNHQVLVVMMLDKSGVLCYVARSAARPMLAKSILVLELPTGHDSPGIAVATLAH